jgi:hypothetical protein
MLFYFVAGLEETRGSAELSALLVLALGQAVVCVVHFRTRGRTASQLPDFIFALPVLAFVLFFVPVFAGSWTNALVAGGSGVACLAMLAMAPSGSLRIDEHTVTIRMGKRRWSVAYSGVAGITIERVKIPLIGRLLGSELCLTLQPSVEKPGFPFMGRGMACVPLPFSGPARLEVHDLLRDRLRVVKST